MKKKLFLKFFLFTVLATMVTFTSCKNYDDDIDNLQGQIKELATKSEMTSQLATLQSALAAAQTDASKAMTEVQKLAGLEKKVTDMMAELETTNAANFEAQKEELNTLMAELKAEVEDALGLMLGMVYSVELYKPAPTATFKTILEKENVFKDGIANALTFTKDKHVQVGDDFIIKVYPTTAIVTPEMISLVNSEGVAYDNIKVTGLKPYKELITRSQGNGNGLWTVSVELKEYKKADFDKATVDPADPSKNIAFAVAINNGGDDESSKVLSNWDLVLKHAPYTQASKLWYFVGDKNVTSIKNRYTIKADLTWSGTPDTAIKTSPANTVADATDDNRSSLTYRYPAVQGEPIKISLTQASGDTKVNAPTNIKGMYVTLDKDRANESAPSELNAWNSYTYSGLNTVVTGTEISITIDDKNAIDDEIGFRVFAVNHDGTLVDPDGKAFYVSLGKPATDWTALNTVITATEEGTTVTNVESAKVDATLTKLTGATTFEWTTDKSTAFGGNPEFTPAFYAYFEDDSGAPLFNTKSGSVTGVDFSEVAKVYTKPRVISWLAYKDDHVYNGKLTIKNATGHVLATLDVTFKKELPTAVKGFSVQTNQLDANGVWNSYLLPSTTLDWTASPVVYSPTGEMLLSNIFNFGTTGTLGRFETTFAASVAGDPLTALKTTSTGPLKVAKSFIDNTTEHPTEVKYNFGKISTETKDASGPVDYIVSLATMKTVYNNIYNSTYTWVWTPREKLTAPVGKDADYYTKKNTAGEYVNAVPYSNTVTHTNDVAKTKTINLDHIYGVSTKSTDYNAFLSAPLKLNSLQTLRVESATFESANGVQEYYTATLLVDGKTITLTPVSTASNPLADVPTTLKIKAKDMYGNDVTISFQMIVKPS